MVRDSPNEAKDQYHSLLKRLTWAVIDGLVWTVSLGMAVWLRYDYDFAYVADRHLIWFTIAAVSLQWTIGFTLGPYGARQVWGSFEETTDIARAAVTVGLVLLIADHLGSTPVPWLPRSVPVTASIIALTGMFAGRFVKRSYDSRLRTETGQASRILIFGAGAAGRSLARSMANDPDSGFVAIGFLDDDRRLRRRRVGGIRVLGNRDSLASTALKYAADSIAIAASQVDAVAMRVITEQAETAGIPVLSVPPVRDIMSPGQPSFHDLRDLDLTELLGRRAITLDMTAIAEQISRKRILVTGAGGSIGSELCRQIARFGPEKIYMLDRDESGLQATQMSITGTGLLEGDQLVLADIRDRSTIHDLFQSLRPQVVFHAAALKHLTLLENYPDEGWKSNVLGTLNVLEAAQASDVEVFVNISTDKAANPTCVLGYSKRLAERLTANFASVSTGRFVSVRFGNVLGSRGSVIHVFTNQIRRGGPLVVTHPDIERYFMLIPEACQLVLEAASIGTSGEVMVLDMGQPMKIADMARELIRRSGQSGIQIEFSGLRPGEKLSEELFAGAEHARRTDHELVNAVDVPRIDPRHVRIQSFSATDDSLDWMRRNATQYPGMEVLS